MNATWRQWRKEELEGVGRRRRGNREVEAQETDYLWMQAGTGCHESRVGIRVDMEITLTRGPAYELLP